MQLKIETLQTYTEKDAGEIGRLMPYLSSSFTSDPIPEELLCRIIASPLHDQLVARDENGRIIGTATLSVIYGAGAGMNAWLEDFVVDPDIQGAGIGSKLWDAMIEWCKAQHVGKLGFTSRPSRTAAHAFYVKRGAEIRDTSYFKKAIQ